MRTVAVMGLTLALLPSLGGVAFANHSGPGQLIGGFEIDGDFVFPNASLAGSTADWANVANPQRFDDITPNSADDAFGGGSKESDLDTWSYATDSIPGKANLTRAYFSSKLTLTNAYLWMAFEREEIAGQGDVHVDFEFNKLGGTILNADGVPVPNRQPGDLLIIYDYAGGTGPVDIDVLMWSGPALSGSWVDAAPPPNAVAGDINYLTTVTRPGGVFGGGTVTDRRFGEAGIDLEATLGKDFLQQLCPGFTTMMVKTRSSGESIDSQLKDKLGPVPIVLSTCGKVIVHKEDDKGAALNGATFELWRDNGNGTFSTTTDTLVGTCVTGTAPDPAGQCTFSTVTPGSSYFVRETIPPPGYLLDPTVVGPLAVGFQQTVTVSHTFVNTPKPGAVTINKVAPASEQTTVFAFTITCTNPNNVYHTTITGSGSTTVSGIPAGSSCTVTEDALPGAFATPIISPSGAFTIGPDQTVTVTVTNALNPGSLTISKSTPTGTGLTLPASFTFDIACTNPTNSYTLVVPANGSATQTGIPAGSICTVTEQVPAGFETPTYSPSQTVTIVAAQTVTVSVTNALQPGAVQITKVAPAGEGSTVFDFTITCTNPANVYQASITGSGTATVSGIPAGSICQVTEDPLSPAFAPPTIVPSGTFTVGANQTVSVLVTNALNPGSLTIAKTTPVVPGLTLPSSFTFDISCTNPTASYTLVVPANGSATQSGIPAGSICTVTEQVPAGFETPTYSPSQTVTIVAAQTVTVSVANALLPGSLTISKVAPAGASGPFTFDVACTNPTNAYVLVVPANGSATQTGIPAGSVCTVTERLPDGFAAPTYSPSQTVTIINDQTVTVSVSNALLPLGLSIVKTATPTSGAPGAAVTYTYVVTNTGQVTLLDVSVDDDKLGHIGTIPVLLPGESVTLTKATTLPTSAGALTNVGTAAGHDAFGRTVSVNDDAVVTVVLAKVVRKPLPKTGTPTGLLLLAGFGLVALGGALRLSSRFRLRPLPATSHAGLLVMAQATGRARWVRGLRMLRRPRPGS